MCAGGLCERETRPRLTADAKEKGWREIQETSEEALGTHMVHVGRAKGGIFSRHISRATWELGRRERMETQESDPFQRKLKNILRRLENNEAWPSRKPKSPVERRTVFKY